MDSNECPRAQRLLVWIALLLGVVAGEPAGFLAVDSGATIATALGTASAAFAGTIALALTVMKAGGWLSWGR